MMGHFFILQFGAAWICLHSTNTDRAPSLVIEIRFFICFDWLLLMDKKGFWSGEEVQCTLNTVAVSRRRIAISGRFITFCPFGWKVEDESRDDQADRKILKESSKIGGNARSYLKSFTFPPVLPFCFPGAFPDSDLTIAAATPTGVLVNLSWIWSLITVIPFIGYLLGKKGAFDILLLEQERIIWTFGPIIWKVFSSRIKKKEKRKEKLKIRFSVSSTKNSVACYRVYCQNVTVLSNFDQNSFIRDVWGTQVCIAQPSTAYKESTLTVTLRFAWNSRGLKLALL